MGLDGSNLKKYKKVHTQKSKLLLLPIFLFLTFGIFPFSNLQAQEEDELATMRVVGQANKLSGEIIADRDDNRDINGNLTAGLRVVSDLTGLTFRSNNGIHKVQQLPGYNLLYLSSNERVVQIFKEGFPPFQLVLNDEGINLNAGEVWEVQITGNQKSTTEPVQFTVSPENSRIIIDGEPNDIDGTVFNTELTTGKHFIQVRKEQYEFRDDSITVSADRVNSFQFSLEEINPIPVLISSEPEGASIYVNDSPGSSGQTPQRILLYPGDLKVRLTLPGYSNIEDELILTTENPELNYNLQKYVGYLTVNATPSNATVLVDDVPQSSKENIELVPGVHSLEVRSSGFDAVSRTFTVNLGDTLVQDISLGQITGNLFVVAQQDNVKFTLRQNGNIVEEWTGPRTIRDLPVGNYSLTGNLQNFDPKTELIEILRNGDKNVNFDLNRVDGRGSLTINSLFADAELELKGPGFSRTYTELPLKLPSIPYGQYEIKIEKDGFDDIEQKLQVNSLTQEVTFVDEYNPRSKGKAVWRSILPGAVFPGVGHGYLGKGRGFLYFLAGAGAIGYSVKSYLDYGTSYDKYQTSLEEYNSAQPGSNFAELEAAYVQEYDNAQTALDGLKLGITAYLAVKGIEIFDLLLQPSNKKKFEQAKLEFNAQNSGISMKVNF